MAFVQSNDVHEERRRERYRALMDEGLKNIYGGIKGIEDHSAKETNTEMDYLLKMAALEAAGRKGKGGKSGSSGSGSGEMDIKKIGSALKTVQDATGREVPIDKFAEKFFPEEKAVPEATPKGESYNEKLIKFWEKNYGEGKDRRSFFRKAYDWAAEETKPYRDEISDFFFLNEAKKEPDLEKIAKDQYKAQYPTSPYPDGPMSISPSEARERAFYAGQIPEEMGDKSYDQVLKDQRKRQYANDNGALDKAIPGINNNPAVNYDPLRTNLVPYDYRQSKLIEKVGPPPPGSPKSPLKSGLDLIMSSPKSVKAQRDAQGLFNDKERGKKLAWENLPGNRMLSQAAKEALWQAHSKTNADNLANSQGRVANLRQDKEVIGSKQDIDLVVSGLNEIESDIIKRVASDPEGKAILGQIGPFKNLWEKMKSIAGKDDPQYRIFLTKIRGNLRELLTAYSGKVVNVWERKDFLEFIPHENDYAPQMQAKIIGFQSLLLTKKQMLGHNLSPDSPEYKEQWAKEVAKQKGVLRAKEWMLGKTKEEIEKGYMEYKKTGKPPY